MDASARTWKTIAKSYRWVLSRCDHNARLLSVWQREGRETIKGLRAEVARLKELQPCGHPIQAIRSTPYIGDQHSNYCSWCADIDAARQKERERCAQIVEDLARHYPEAVFVPPEPGQHGKTVDACSAAAIRGIIPSIAAAIREAPAT